MLSHKKSKPCSSERINLTNWINFCYQQLLHQLQILALLTQALEMLSSNTSYFEARFPEAAKQLVKPREDQKNEEEVTLSPETYQLLTSTFKQGQSDEVNHLLQLVEALK